MEKIINSYWHYYCWDNSANDISGYISMANYATLELVNANNL